MLKLGSKKSCWWQQCSPCSLSGPGASHLCGIVYRESGFSGLRAQMDQQSEVKWTHLGSIPNSMSKGGWTRKGEMPCNLTESVQTGSISDGDNFGKRMMIQMQLYNSVWDKAVSQLWTNIRDNVCKPYSIAEIPHWGNLESLKYCSLRFFFTFMAHLHFVMKQKPWGGYSKAQCIVQHCPLLCQKL